MKKLIKKMIPGTLLLFGSWTSLFAGQFANLSGDWAFKVSAKPEQNQVIHLESSDLSVDMSSWAVQPDDLIMYDSDAVFVHLYGDMSRPKKQLMPMPGFGFATIEGQDYLILFSEKNGVLKADEALPVIKSSENIIALGSGKRNDGKIRATLSRVR